jgi:hypothetical protein
MEKALSDRRAALDTTVRQREQAVVRELMDEAWHELPATLDEHWRRAEGRRDWCTSACSLAARALSRDHGFVVELDPAAPDDAATTVDQELRTATGASVEVRRVPALGSGLRIRSGRACVDATVQGLLASRERIESELLAELERLVEPRKET